MNQKDETERSTKPNMSRTRLKPLTDKAVGARVGVEVIALFLCTIPLIFLYLVHSGDYEPYQRGFFCDDESLKHPFLEEQITVHVCAVIWMVAVLFLVILVELVTNYVYSFPQWKQSLQERGAGFTAKLPRIVVETYRILGYFIVGALFCTLTTELAKYKIGRLRPYFLTVCQPDMSPETCKDSNGYPIFVMNYTCNAKTEEELHIVREARKSFLSGHSSFSFYSAVFIIMYLHARLSSRSRIETSKKGNEEGKCVIISRFFLRGLKTLRPFIQFGCFIGAFYIALSRISDYRHHPTDVITGIIVGLFYAAIILMFIVDLFNRPRSFEVKYEQIEGDEENPMGMETVDAPKNNQNSGGSTNSTRCTH